jgi:hypothetical protein
MPWETLLPPVRRAVEALLSQVNAAVPNDDDEADVARCFLVTGERGTGKTTVLMTARQLCEHSSRGGKPPPKRVSALAEQLSKRARWLELLDAEPLQPKANFLTLLLAQIRNAIDRQHGDARRTRRSSPLEERASSACERLDRLIHEAAQIWEEIHESSTRDRAHRQVTATEYLLRFRHDLICALAEAGSALAEHAHDESVVLAVPIDNIDRSAEHLYSIFKLAQLVTCRHLILVFACDRVELNVLLERSYWKEVTLGGAPPNGDEDEAHAIARRQAAAIMSKLLPPGNRVEVDLVKAEDALSFAPYAGAERLETLLRQIRLSQASPKVLGEPTNFLELFVHEDPQLDHLGVPPSKASPDQRGGPPRPLTELGEDALHLPARALHDLWLLAARERDRAGTSSSDFDPARTSSSDFDPARIARTMVRLMVAESKLPHWAAHRMQDDILCRSVKGRTQLLLKPRSGDASPFVDVRCLWSLAMSFKGDDPSAKASTLDFAAIELHHKHRFVVEIHRGDGSAGSHDPMLEPRVAAWFMLLHDLLVNDEESLVINEPDDFLDGVGPRVCTYLHGWTGDDRPFALRLPWPQPSWGTFYEQTIVSQAWARIGEKFKKEKEEIRDARQRLALSWIDLVLRFGSNEPITWEDAHTKDRDLDAWTDETLERARTCLASIQKDLQHAYQPKTSREIRRRMLHDWILEHLPRFFSGELCTGLTLAPKRWEETMGPRPRSFDRWRKHAIERALRRAWAAQADDPHVVELARKIFCELDALASTEPSAATA